MEISKITLNIKTKTKESMILINILLILCGSLLLAISARISINILISPVPITAQTFAVLLIGFLYKKKVAVATVITYILEGLAGFPVFANPGSGISYIFSPTFGYLLGFIFAIYFLSYLNENKIFDSKKLYKIPVANSYLSVLKFFSLLLAANLLIYIPGILWLSLFVGFKKSLLIGFYPFIIGDLLKVTSLLLLLIGTSHFVKNNKNIQ